MKKSIILSILSLGLIACTTEYFDIDIYQQTSQSQQDTTVVPPMVGVNSSTGSSTDNLVSVTNIDKFAGYTYNVTCSYPWTGNRYPYNYYKAVKKTGVDFLTNVVTTAVSGTSANIDYVNKFSDMGLFYSEDLNSSAGGSYCRIGFQGQVANTTGFQYVYSSRYNERQDESKIITGLACISITDGSDAPETIKDIWGVTWTLAPSYKGSSNMNNGTRKSGDKLFLYYTKEYTGQQITVTNPYYIENYSRLQNNKLMINTLGGISTWIGSNSESWKPCTDALLTGITDKLPLDDYVDNDDRAIKRGVDFIKLNVIEDGIMTPIQGDEQYRPVNWNRSAGGNKIFISYSYIEPSSPYWINQD